MASRSAASSGVLSLRHIAPGLAGGTSIIQEAFATSGRPPASRGLGEDCSGSINKCRNTHSSTSRNPRPTGIIIQPYWRNLYNHSVAAVKNHGMHPMFELDLHQVWLDEEV